MGANDGWRLGRSVRNIVGRVLGVADGLEDNDGANVGDSEGAWEGSKLGV